MQGCKHRPTRRLKRSRRDGAILLDLFLATLIFSICVIAIGQFGSQSLQIAKTTAVERMAILKAESILAKQVAFGPHRTPKVWQEALQGIPLTIRVTWNETAQHRLHRVTVEVAAINDMNAGRNTASLSRLVFVSEDK